LRALRHRNFRLFFIGQLISVTGSWMQSTAQQWLVYRLTDSQLSLGAVTFSGLLPVLLLSLFMGVVVDRFPRRKILLFTQSWFMIGAAILAILTFLGVIQYWHILLLAFLLGISNALDMPTRQAFYIDLIEREEILNAIALNSSVFNGARIIGPAIGGFIVARLGESPAFAINSLSYLAVLMSLLLMRLPPFSSDRDRVSGFASFKQGLQYLVGERRVLGLVSMIAISSTLTFPYLVLLPAIARDVLDIGVEGFGTLMAAQGVGALLGALSLAIWGDHRKKGRLLTLSRGFLTIALIGLGVSHIPILSMLALSLAGYSLIMQLAVTNTLVQTLVPDDLRGRVMSTYTWALAGFFPLGSLLIGWLGDQFGTLNAVLLAAGSSVVIMGLNRWLFPKTAQLA
jgi:MFS family permease